MIGYLSPHGAFVKSVAYTITNYRPAFGGHALIQFLILKNVTLHAHRE
jgi:hypothetical protein